MKLASYYRKLRSARGSVGGSARGIRIGFSAGVNALDTAARCSFAKESVHCISREPGTALGDSISSGWTNGVIGLVRGLGFSGEFESTKTADQMLVVVTKGSMKLEVFGKGKWRSALRKTGSVGLTPADHTNRLRWTALGASNSFETAHIFIPQALIAGAADELRRRGESLKGAPVNAMAIHDPIVTNLALALVAAYRSQGGNLLASSIVQALAMRLASLENGWLEPDRGYYGGSLSGVRLERLLDFMRVHFARDLSIERLAREAGLSPFHLIRAFKASVGIPPHRYLVDLRLEAAATLLRESERSVADVARACGFSSASHLSTAFHRRFACTPSESRLRSHGERAS